MHTDCGTPEIPNIVITKENLRTLCFDYVGKILDIKADMFSSLVSSNSFDKFLEDVEKIGSIVAQMSGDC
jgi:hypothetical protein